MQALLDNLWSELRGAWRFRRYALAVAWGVCLCGWLVVYAIPDTFEAKARVNVDTKTALSNVLDGQVIRQDFDAQLNLIRQALLGRANLEYVAQQVDMNLTAMAPAEREQALRSLSERIQIALEPPTSRDPRVPNTLYGITIRDSDRQRAIKVVDVLLNGFMEGTLGADRTGTASAQRFLQEQLAEYGRRLAEAEGRLAEFKKNNVGLVPGDQGDYFQRLNSHIQGAEELESQLTVATSRRAELQRQLRGETPFVPLTESGGAPRTAGGAGGSQDTSSRLQEAQARLDDMLLRFTDRHPDVIAMRETLEQLRARQKEELAALRRGDAGAAAVSGAHSNPVYQNIQLQLNQVEVEIAALRSRLADRNRNVAELRRLVDTVPEVEAEYARLTRDDTVTRAQYNSLLERLERARLSGDAEQSGGSVKFNVVDPAAASFSPIFPNRPLMLILVFILGLAAGGGVAYLMHMVKAVFPNARSLAEATGLTVLGSVTRTWVDQQRQDFRRGLMRYSAACGLLMLLFVTAVLVQEPASRMLRRLIGT